MWVNPVVDVVGTPVGGTPDGGVTFTIIKTLVDGTVVTTSSGSGTTSTNLTEVGGAAIALGQTTMANSLPVVIASNQSAIPVSGTVIANQGSPNTAPNSWPVEITDGTNILGTLSHPVRIDPTGTTVQPVSGTVTVTPSGLQNVNVTQLNSVALGSPSAFGTSPGIVNVLGMNAFVINTITDNLFEVAGVVLGASAITNFGVPPAAANVPGVNASLFAGTTALTTTSGNLNVSLTSTTITGTVTVVGGKGNNNSVPGFNNVGVVPGIANAATQTWTEGDQVLESMDLSGRQRVRGTLTANSAAPDADGQMTLTHLANASAPSYTEGNLVLASCDLSGNTRIIGTKTNNSAAPTTQVGVIPALANAVAPTWTEGDQVLLSEDLSGNLRVTLSGTNVVTGALTNNNAAPTTTLLGVLPAIAETAYATVTYTTGDMVLPVTDLHGAANTDLQAVAGTAVVTAAAGIQKVGISGATGATLDGVITAAAAPANGLAVLSVNSTAAPSLTTGQSVALQSDYVGSVFVKQCRRSQTSGKATTISTTAATAVTGTPGAGIFVDLASLIITITPQATTGEAVTATLSDGTNSYVYDLFTGVAATLAPTSISATYSPPLPAASAATAWTMTISSATIQPVVHVTTVVVLQKAS